VPPAAQRRLVGRITNRPVTASHFAFCRQAAQYNSFVPAVIARIHPSGEASSGRSALSVTSERQPKGCVESLRPRQLSLPRQLLSPDRDRPCALPLGARFDTERRHSFPPFLQTKPSAGAFGSVIR